MLSLLLPACSSLLPNPCQSTSRWQRRATTELSAPRIDRRAALAAALAAAAAPAHAQQLTFATTPTGLRYADIKPGTGTGEEVVSAESRVTFHVKGRLVGKQGWVFVDSQEEDEPYRLTMNKDDMIPGLAEGLLGMQKGGSRRLVIPSTLGYSGRDQQPVPRSFGQRQRLFGTVLNQNRLRQESEGLGAGNDVAGVVALDIQVINVRPPL